MEKTVRTSRLSLCIAFCTLFSLNALAIVHLPKTVDQPMDPKLAETIKDVGITEKLGTKIPLGDLHFTDETGASVPFQKYFDGKHPVILTLTYYRCPNLCSFLYNGLLEGLKKLDWTPGNQFQIVNVGIDPKENHTVASEKLDNYVRAYGRPESKAGWHFLTGEETQIKKLADAVGFRFKLDMVDNQYAHAASIFIISPEGMITRYLYGIQFSQQDLKFSLIEASAGKVGTVIEKALLLCFRYDSHARKYSVVVGKVMRVGGFITLLFLGGYLALFWRRQRGVTTHV